MDEKIKDVLELRRTAKEVKRHTVVMRIIAEIQASLDAKQKLNDEQGITQEQVYNAVSERLFGKKNARRSIKDILLRRNKADNISDMTDAQKLEAVVESELTAEEAEAEAIRKKERADRLREERKIIEQTPFRDIYKEYSQNPVHIIGRLFRKLKNRGKNE